MQLVTVLITHRSLGMQREYEEIPQRLDSLKASPIFGRKEKFLRTTKTPHKDFDFKSTIAVISLFNACKS